MNYSARKQYGRELEKVETFNKANQIGAKVTVIKDDKSRFETVTISEAWVLGDHTAVVKVKGISGCYLLDRVIAADSGGRDDRS